MLDRLNDEICLCFQWAELESVNNNIEENMNYKAAAELIRAYNELVKLYYKKQYQNEFLKGSVENATSFIRSELNEYCGKNL